MNENLNNIAAPSIAPRVKSQRLAVVLYSCAVFLYWAGLYLYVPTLPVYAQTRTSDLALIGTILSMYGLWQAIIRLPLGIAADWVGKRKPFILVGFGLVGLGAWMMGTSQDVNGLLIGRAVTGLSAGTWVLLVVAFSSFFPPEQAVRATALLTIINSSGRLLATSLTGPLNLLGGYPLPFFIATGAAALAVLVIIPTPEQPRSSQRLSIKDIGTLITRRDVIIPAILNAVAQHVTWATTFGFFPILAKKLGANDITQSMLVTVYLLIMIIGSLSVARLNHRISSRTMVYFSIIVTAVGILIGALANSLLWLFVAQILAGLAAGVGYPVMMGLSIEQVDDARRATAMGLHQAVYAIGMFTGPWLSEILANSLGIQPMFVITAAVCMVLGLIGTRLIPPAPKKVL